MAASFEHLIADGESADISGWDFTWLNGRATEQRPSWGFQRLLADRLAGVGCALDIQTGGGEVLAGVPDFPSAMVATESWPPNLILATQRLHPRGVVVVDDSDEPPLPFADNAFDLVSSRHPATVWWNEIARVLRPRGNYFAQHVGADSNVELYEFFLGPQRRDTGVRHADHERGQAEAAGFEIIDLRSARLRVEFFDVGAVVHFLRKVIWTVPDFSVPRYRERLRELDRTIRDTGSFVSHSTRTLIDARRR